MNAAFVLLTSALLTGHHPGGASCNSCSTATVSSCDSCQQESFGHRLQGRLRGLFSGHGCKEACDTCPAPAPAPAPACTTACDSCNGREGLFARLRARFHRSDDCCEASCSTCASAPAATVGTVTHPATTTHPAHPPATGQPAAKPLPPATTPPPPAKQGETIKDAPKKLPAVPKGAEPAKIGELGTDNPIPPAPLAIEGAPVINPNPFIQPRPAPTAIPSSLRNPF